MLSIAALGSSSHCAPGSSLQEVLGEDSTLVLSTCTPMTQRRSSLYPGHRARSLSTEQIHSVAVLPFVGRGGRKAPNEEQGWWLYNNVKVFTATGHLRKSGYDWNQG